MFSLRDYQQGAVDAAINWMRKSIEPAVLELCTGAGKSFIIAAIANWVYSTHGKKVLCLQPSKELTEQNHEKYQLTGERAGIFSASAGRRDMRWPVVYGTPGTVKNSIDMFGDQFAAVIIDESHSLTPTIKTIIDGIRRHNANLRVIGLTATPYRANSGYIYQYSEQGKWEEEASEPYFNTLLYRVTAHELIDKGFLTAPTTTVTDAHYSTGGLQLNNRGQFDSKDVERAFEGKGRLTSDIVAEVVQHSVGRQGVMLFAATVNHAKEIMESLPPENSRMIGGDINSTKRERARLIKDFKKQRFKYLVSVGMLTTGFDAPHVDVVAVLRKTESPGLFQQIIGRGCRLYDGKQDFLLLDFAGNIEFHDLADDVFTPRIKTRKQSDGEAPPVKAECPECKFENIFTARPNPSGLKHDKHGYLIDLMGKAIMGEHGAEPAHYGRRCTGQIDVGGGRLARCEYRWTFKECEECHQENDIAARFCESCRAELINPNDKLKLEFKRIKEDPYAVSTDEILAWDAVPHVGRSGKPSVRCDIKTPYRTFTVWHMPEKKAEWTALCKSVFDGHVAPTAELFLKFLATHGKKPTSVTCHRIRGSKFYNVIDYNRPIDVAPTDTNTGADATAVGAGAPYDAATTTMASAKDIFKELV